VGYSCEHSKESSCSIKFWEILVEMKDWWLLKKDSAPIELVHRRCRNCAMRSFTICSFHQAARSVNGRAENSIHNDGRKS
jgi:hypothetical protein